jgi:hypothetical protein
MTRGTNTTRTFLLSFSILMVVLSSCSGPRTFTDKKYSPEKLKKDFTIFRGALEEFHPSLYWFTPKDSMDMAFNEAYNALNDSMTERQFRTTLLKVIADIRCGHTSVNFSKKYSRYLDTAQLNLFPLILKVLKDTLVVTGRLNKKDSALIRGSVITSINNRSSKMLIDTFLNYVTGDGNSITGKYQSLSSYGSFGVMYKNLYGLPDSFNVNFINNYGEPDSVVIPVFKPVKEEENQSDSLKPEKYTAKERRNMFTYSSRSLQIDTTLHSGYMIVNTFVAGKGIRKFFKRSFRSMKRLNIQHLVVDVRSNGGGDAGISTLLTRYISDHSFVLADSLYAIKRSSRYHRHIHMQPIYWLMTAVVTRKHSDGKFHFGYFERHRFKPVKKHHFDRNVYLLTGGNSFSATTLFVQELKGQKNVKVIGEETGGGGYGNTAWIIPELKLPNTRIRVGIPKLRFVMRPELVREARGVLPDLYVAPTSQDIRNGIDVKVEAVRQMVLKANGY